MAILLTDDEIEALQGMRHFHCCLYILGIRRHMDYATGIAGIKRKISYSSLASELQVESHQGFEDARKNSRDQIKRALAALEKSGLIKRQSVVTKNEKQLILKCLLAQTDGSVQNKPAPHPPWAGLVEAAPQAAPLEIKETSLKTTTSNNNLNESRPTSHQGGFCSEKQKPAPYPVSGNYNTGGGDNARDLMSEFKQLIYQGKYELRYPQTWDGKTISMISAWIRQGVTLAEAEIAMDNAKAKATTPIRHPAYYLQAVLRYQHDSQEIRKKSDEVKNDARRTQKPNTASDKRAEAHRKFEEWRKAKICEAEREAEEGEHDKSG